MAGAYDTRAGAPTAATPNRALRRRGTFESTYSKDPNNRPPQLLPNFSNVLGSFLELDDLLGPREYHRCHEVKEMIANDGIESSVGGM